jgi:hypothetical protein
MPCDCGYADECDGETAVLHPLQDGGMCSVLSCKAPKREVQREVQSREARGDGLASQISAEVASRMWGRKGSCGSRAASGRSFERSSERSSERSPEKAREPALSPLKQRIVAALDARPRRRMNYHDLAEALWPPNLHPKAWNRSSNGGPCGWAMPLGRALRELSAAGIAHELPPRGTKEGHGDVLLLRKPGEHANPSGWARVA